MAGGVGMGLLGPIVALTALSVGMSCTRAQTPLDLQLERLRASSDEECRQSVVCKERGECTLRFVDEPDGECVAGSDADCEQSTKCKEDDHCTEWHGFCRLTKRSKRAERERAITDEVAGSDEECKGRSVNGICMAAGDDECKQSRGCKEGGHCTFASGMCVVAGDEDCKKSSGCETYGRCIEKGGDCVAPEPAAQSVPAELLDAAKKILERDEDRGLSGGEPPLALSDSCVNTIECVEQGHCSFVKVGPGNWGVCLARYDWECNRLGLCKKEGLCTPKDGECQATRDEDCKRTGDCTFRGNCSAVRGSCMPARDEDCKQSKTCKILGYCAAAWPRGKKSLSRCLAGSDEDCKQSELCTDEGQCTFNSKTKKCVK